jgi:hypothetical protein
MVAQYSIYSALYSLTRTSKTLSFSMMPIRKLSDSLCQSSSFLSIKVSSLQASCINGNRLSNCISLKNMSRKMGLNTCVGAEIFRWKFKIEVSNIQMQKARISRPSLLSTRECMMSECTLIIALHAIYCNTLMGCYV